MALCEMTPVSVENRDMFTLLCGVKISCKATLISLPLVKGNLLILGRNHVRTSLEASAKLYGVGVSNTRLWSGGVLHVKRDEGFYRSRCHRVSSLCLSEVGKEVLNLANYTQIQNHLSPGT